MKIRLADFVFRLIVTVQNIDMTLWLLCSFRNVLHKRLKVLIYIYIYLRICIYAYIYQVYIYIETYTYTYIYYIYIYIYIGIICIYTYIYMSRQKCLKKISSYINKALFKFWFVLDFRSWSLSTSCSETNSYLFLYMQLFF